MIDWSVLKDLTQLYAIASHEQPVMDYVETYLNTPLKYDGLGSGLLTQGNSGVNIMLATHTDEVGFVVSKIEDNGYLRVQPVGNMWPHTLLFQRVMIKDSLNRLHFGIFGGPAVHSLPLEERKKVIDIDRMYIDLGLSSKEEVEALHISIGAMVCPIGEYQELANPNFIVAKALDNRVSVALGAWLMQYVQQKQVENTVTLALTVQEEVGLRGARTTAQMIRPDLAIAIDTGVAGDTPFDKNNVVLGKGVAINVIDSMTVTNRGLLIYLEKLCQKRGIPYQLSCCVDGGTDAGNIHKSGEGILATTLSVPMRYMHTHQGVVHKADIQATFDLLVAIIEELTPEVYHKILMENYHIEEV